MAVPSDHNIKVKVIEKLKKYTNLQNEAVRMWDVRATTDPVIFEIMGVNTSKLKVLH